MSTDDFPESLPARDESTDEFRRPKGHWTIHGIHRNEWAAVGSNMGVPARVDLTESYGKFQAKYRENDNPVEEFEADRWQDALARFI